MKTGAFVLNNLSGSYVINAGCVCVPPSAEPEGSPALKPPSPNMEVPCAPLKKPLFNGLCKSLALGPVSSSLNRLL